MTVTFFSESRLNLSRGTYRSESPNLRGDAWKRGLSGLRSMRLAARVRTGVAQGEPVVGEVAALPNYTGTLGLLRGLPRLALAVDRAVRSSSVVVVRLPGPIGLVAAAAARLRRVPVAVDLAGDAGEVVRAGAAGRLSKWLAPIANHFTAWAVRGAGAVRYVTKDALQRAFPARPGVTALGYSAVQLPDDWLAQVPQAGTSKHAALISVGNHAQLYKGHDLIIKTMAKLRMHHPDITLTLVGSGRRQRDLEELAKNLGVASHVKFVGYIESREQLRAMIDDSWLYLQPSRTEGLPRALVEAMARGKACVATPVGGIPELLNEEQIVPVDDVAALEARVLALLGNREVRQRMGERNLSVAQGFTSRALHVQNAAWLAAVQRLIDS